MYELKQLINFKINANTSYKLRAVRIVKVEDKFYSLLEPDGRDLLKNVECKNDFVKPLFWRLV